MTLTGTPPSTFAVPKVPYSGRLSDGNNGGVTPAVKSRLQPNELAFRSTGFIRKSRGGLEEFKSASRSAGGAHSSSPSMPDTPSKPSLPYYFNTTNSSRLRMLYPLSATSNDAAQTERDHFQENFIIVSKLGSGFFADAFKVVSVHDGSFYAVKRTKQPFHGENDRMMKRHEVNVMVALGSSPYLVSLISSWEQSGLLYMQLEYCDNGSLATFLDSIPFEKVDVDTVLSILADLVMGLHHMHSRDIVHLDLKPANVLLSGVHSCKIADFGMAYFLDSLQNCDGAEGDRVYMAPEILEGIYGKHCDMFSLGLVLLEIITNCQLPDSGDAWVNLRQGDFSDIPSIRDDLLPLMDIVQALLVNDYTARPSVDQLLLHPLIAPLVYSRLKIEEE
eukprot:Partr_v1_DN24834_c0_g1_i1_m29696 putative Protein kinase, membrane associated tyrosine threonine 1